MADLTDEMVRDYIDRKGSTCPFCKSEGSNLEGSRVEIDAETATQHVRCETCGEEWRDVYVLSGVDVLDPLGRYKTTIFPGESNGAAQEQAT